MSDDAPRPSSAVTAEPSSGAAPAHRLGAILEQIGWLVPLSVALAAGLMWLVQSVPAYGGYTWLSAAWVLRSVVLREWFPTAASCAWLLGYLSVPSRRAELRLLRPWLFPKDGGEVRWKRWAGVLLVGGSGALAAKCLSPGYSAADVLAFALATVWVVHRRIRGDDVRVLVLDLGRVVLLFIAVSYVFTAVKSQLFVLRAPVDTAIVRLESSLFGEPPHRWVAGLAAANPWLAEVFDEAYFRLFDHMTVGSVFLLGAGLQRERGRLWTSLAVCYILGGFAYYIVPGLGPCYTEPELYSFVKETAPGTYHTQAALLANTEVMGGTMPIVIPTYAFVACMPSLHMAHEFALLYYARSSRVFFGMSLAFVVLTWVATLGLGWHYAVDVVGGAVLAAASVMAAEKLGDKLFPTASSETGKPGLRGLGAMGWATLMLGLVVLMAHGASLANGFALDDVHLVVSARLKELEDLAVVLSSGLYELSGDPRLIHAFRPVSGLLNWGLWQLCRTEASAQHLANLLLGSLMLAALVSFLRQAGISLRVAVGAAVVVAIHPLTAESLAYSAARDLTLSWTLWLILASRASKASHRTWLAVAIATAAAALTHESFLILAAAAVLLPLPASVPRGRHWRLEVLAGYLLGVGGALLARLLGTPEAWNWANPIPFLTTISLRTLRALVLPVDLSPLVAVDSGSALLGWAALLAFAVAVLVGERSANRWRVMRLAGVGLFLVGATCLAQAVGGSLVRVVADRGALGVLVGVVIAVTPVVERVAEVGAQRLDRPRKLLLGSVGVAIVLAVLPLTWSNGLTYKNDEALARLLLQANPEDPSSRARAGLMLAYKNELDVAEPNCRSASHFAAGAYDAELCLAVVATRREHDEEALARVTRYLERYPRRLEARKTLWHLLVKQRRLDELRRWVARLSERVGKQPDIVQVELLLERRRTAVNPMLQQPE